MSLETLYCKIFASFISHGSVEMVIGTSPPFMAKGAQEGPAIRLQIDNSAPLRAMIINPELGIPEAYMDGRLRLIETSIDDFLIFLFKNKQEFATTRFGRFLSQLHLIKHAFSGAIHKGAAKANVAHHYDLTDALYDCFLDERRQYSCAYYESADDTLEQAQLQKIARLGAKLKLRKNARILDVGCGWGELAYALCALETGVEVHGITLSENQLSYAQSHVATRADKPASSFALQDYRDEQNKYDNIVSVGMLEHVGRKSYDDYFKMVSQCLAQDGTAVIHTIGKRKAWPTTSPFITKYIFPGGYIPTLADLSNALCQTDLHIADIESMHHHYAYTLRDWRTRCEAKKDHIIALYDERFYRMWLFYLTSCEYFFRLDEGVVYQIQLIKTRDETPSTRGYITRKEQKYLKKLWQQKNHFGKSPPSQR